jgi:hypothetical protein
MGLTLVPAVLVLLAAVGGIGARHQRDIAQAALAGVGPVALGFGADAEAQYFYGQAATEIAVIAGTDWNAA